MAEITISNTAGAGDSSNPAYQAYKLLHIGFVLVPLIAGLDKFLELLTEWTQYLWPVVPGILGISGEAFMSAVGGIEIAAAIMVAVKPKIGAYVVCAWLVGIIINLLLLGEYYDIALRDLGLAVGAFALARLATAFADD